jgi:integrase
MGRRGSPRVSLLQAGQPIHVVAERRGHANIKTTLETYAHVLPDMLQDADVSSSPAQRLIDPKLQQPRERR